jgi:hypothetical protein
MPTIIFKTNMFTRKSTILIKSLVVCVHDIDLHSIAVDSGQLLQFSFKGFPSLAGFFSNHLSHRYGLQQTFSFCCLDNQFSIRLDLFQILISPISLVCSSLTDTGGSGCRCNILSRNVSYDVANEVSFSSLGTTVNSYASVVVSSTHLLTGGTVLCKLHQIPTDWFCPRPRCKLSDNMG